MIRVLVADDEALMRAGIRLILETAGDIEVVAEAEDGPAAVRACRDGAVDVALLDVRMPGGDGLTAAARIGSTAPATRVLVLTTFHDPKAVTAALRAGALGFLLKDTPPAQLLHAVRAADRGDPVLAPQVTRDLVERHLAQDGDGDARGAEARRRLAGLTPTELDVLAVVAEGAPNGEIAGRLHLATGTVKAHLSHILTKLGCDNRVQAAVLAHEAGLLRPPPKP